MCGRTKTQHLIMGISCKKTETIFSQKIQNIDSLPTSYTLHSYIRKEALSESFLNARENVSFVAMRHCLLSQTLEQNLVATNTPP
jgi:hypothetical protein